MSPTIKEKESSMPESHMDHQHVAPVFSGLMFPARTWQLIAQADYYGADYHLRAALSRLPDGDYVDLAAVVGALGNPTPPNSPRPMNSVGWHGHPAR
jgi:hypothetical protein